MSLAIDVNNATVHYGPVLALDSASLQLHRGTVCALIGMNGSGKSTLFKTIMGLIKPDTGTVKVNGLDPQLARKRAAIGYVPQNEAVDWDFPISVREVVMTGRYGTMGLLRRARKSDHAAVDAALERVGLTSYADRQIGQLSGGQKKRTFVARCIAQEANIMLLDEPFAGVDKRSEGTITDLLREIAAEDGSVLVSTHDLHALPTLADEAVLLMTRVLMQGDPQEVLQPENLAMAFGLDPMNRGEK